MAEFRNTILYQKTQWDDDQKAMKAQQKEFIAKIKRDNPGAKITNVSYKKIKGGEKIEIDNPIENADASTAFRLESKEKQFYLKFGYLLEYIAENILPRIKIGEIHDDNPSIFKIDYSEWSNHMYSFPNQISLDPRVCLVRNSNFNSGRGNTQILQQLSIFREADNGESDASANAAYPMNIYLNFNFLIECLKADDRGDVNIFEFLSAICTGLNKALGGINNLEPIIDEESNTLKIIDTTPIPGYSNKPREKPYTLQLYGYDRIGTNYISNFVRNIDLKTSITPEFATMITVGATAGGYVKGTEATAFSKWNFGLIDRYKEEFTPGNISSVKKSNTEDEAEVTYVNEFLAGGYVTRYGITSLTGDFNLSPDAIERNISVVTEYYKYIIAKESLNQDTSGGTIGFIPFKLGITLDGISGIKIYNKLEVNTEFLPKAYGKTVDLIVTGVSHNLAGNDWQTQIETTVIPKTGKQSVLIIPTNVIQESVQNVGKSPKPARWPYYSDSDAVPLDIESPSKGTPPNSNASVSFSGAIKTEYYPVLKSINGKTKGLKLLALVMSQKEGFYPGSRSYRTNNPGNIGNTDSGANSKLKDLKTGIEKQLTYLYGVAQGTNSNYPLNAIKDIEPYYSPEIDKNQKNYNLTPYLPGYKFKYTGTLEQFVKIYSTGARGGNSYLSIIISFFRKNGFSNVTEKTKLADLIKLNNSDPIIL
jgi:hypothetical protein